MSLWTDGIYIGLLLLVSVASYALTGFLRSYAIKKNLLDIPGERSSHAVPTPRGGGQAIVLVTVVGMLIMCWVVDFAAVSMFALLGAGILVAWVGWRDDHGHVAARWRLLIHFVAAAWVLVWLGGLPPLSVLGVAYDLGMLGHVLAAIYLVWLLNLYNFMDGIDGIASIEAVTVCLGGAGLFWWVNPSATVWIQPVLLAMSVIGFLFWNFPRAKIFMGDVGSGFLGLMLGVFSLQAAWHAPELFWSWLILLGVFLVDATLTLLLRVLRGEKFYEAHRSHAYQWAARRWGHIRVTVVVALINVLWLLPLAGLSVIYPTAGAMLMFAAFLPLTILAMIIGAGRPETGRARL